MDKFEQLQNLVGVDGIEKILQAAAIEAVKSGNWHKVRAIADFALKGIHSSQESYNHRQQDPLAKLGDMDFTDLDDDR
jgi:hypothetical protein